MIVLSRALLASTNTGQIYASAALLVLSLVPALFVLPMSVALLLALVLAARFVLRNSSAHRLALLVLVSLLWVASVEFSEVRWLSGDTLLAAFILALGLKWQESHSPQELQFITVACLLLQACSSLYLEGLAAFLYLLLGGFGGIYLLWIVTLNQSSFSFKGLALSSKMFAAALPLLVVLFISVPRIQGPLWDVGIVMGLPLHMMVDKSQREKGAKVQLRSGNVARAKKADDPVLVANFEGAVPSKSLLYWRGPIYEQFDGENWQLNPAWNSRSQLLKNAFKQRADLDRALRVKGSKVSYEARLNGVGERWLYALDAPYGSSVESFISADFQLLHINKLQGEFNYQLSAYLDYKGGRELNAQQRERYLQLPKLSASNSGGDSNPKLRQWAKKLASTADDEQIVYEFGRALAASDLKIDEQQISINADYDGMFFSQKTAPIEQIAGMSAFTFRAAGLPARLVSGYRAGSLIALTNFVVVREQHRHAWVEVWVGNSGWQRFEAQDLLEGKAVQSKSKTDTATTAATTPKKSEKKLQKVAAKALDSTLKGTKSFAQKERRGERRWGWLQQLSQALQVWVVDYNPQRQVSLLKAAGFKKADWKTLLLLAVASIAAMLIIYTLVMNRRTQSRDLLSLQFYRLNKLLSKQNLDCAENECPSQWLKRLSVQQPDSFVLLEKMIKQYITLRYQGLEPVQQHAGVLEFKRDISRLKGMM